MPTKLFNETAGDPAVVLRLEEYEMPEPDEQEVLVQMIAAAVHPVDINTVQGKYPVKVDIPGYEGLGKVIKLGPGVQKLKVGDHVASTVHAGTWRTHLTIPERSVLCVPKDMPIAAAATLAVNPMSVYLMLKAYVNLDAGDTVIQNGANSACGVIAIQMCKLWGIQTVNVVRDRPNIDQLKTFLKDLGATYVFTEEEIKKTDIFKTGELNNPVLGLNCIGGESASNIIRHLSDEAVLVTYGGMSLQPVKATTTTLVFKNIKLVGFSMSRWLSKEEYAEKEPEIWKEIINMVMKGHLKAPPHVLVPFLNYKEAVKNTLTKDGMVGKKYILDFRTPTNKL